MNFTLNDRAVNFVLGCFPGHQLLRNSEFSNDSVWTDGITGETYWVVGNGVATATLVLVFEATFHLIQTITGAEAGTYLLQSERTLSNMSGDMVRLDFYIYDEDNNLISYYEDTGFTNSTVGISHQFTTLVPVTRIEIDATLDFGSNVNISMPFVRLYYPILHGDGCALDFSLNDDRIDFTINAITLLSGDFRLLEDSFYRLLETGGRRLLE